MNIKSLNPFKNFSKITNMDFNSKKQKTTLSNDKSLSNLSRKSFSTQTIDAKNMSVSDFVKTLSKPINNRGVLASQPPSTPPSINAGEKEKGQFVIEMLDKALNTNGGTVTVDQLKQQITSDIKAKNPSEEIDTTRIDKIVQDIFRRVDSDKDKVITQTEVDALKGSVGMSTSNMNTSDS